MQIDPDQTSDNEFDSSSDNFLGSPARSSEDDTQRALRRVLEVNTVLSKKIVAFENKLSKLETRSEKSIKKVEKQIEEGDKNKLQVIEALAIFVTLFTFISIDIQIFKSSITFISAAGFILMTLGALMFFVAALHFVLEIKSFRKFEIRSKYGAFLVLIVLFLAGGVCLVCIEGNTSLVRFDSEKKTFLPDLANESLKKGGDDLSAFKSCLKEGGWNKCF